tara:strand:+ start:154263 stop:155285 length:1023 start_codon:yes stop_codon:yes gene_type:complete
MEKYLLSADICAPAMAIAGQLQIDKSELLAGLDVSLRDLEDPKYLLHTDTYLELLQRLFIHSDDPSLGLTAGSLARFQALGIMGLAMLSAPNYKAALQLGIKFSGISGSIGQLRYVEGGDIAAFQVDLPPMSDQLARYLVEEQFASIYQYQAALLGAEYTPGCGSKVLAQEIHFTYPQPKNVERYQALFKCKLVFDAPDNRLWVGAEHLNKPLPLSNEVAFEMCESQCLKLLDERKEQDMLVREVQNLLLKLPHAFPTIDEIAAQVDLTGRSLRRRLDGSGYSFTRLLENAKCGLAVDLLGNPALTIEEISALLGYTEVTNFRRAFKKWKGLSPSQFRRN